MFLETLLRHVKTARFLGDSLESLKRNVFKRINLAIKKIGENDPRLATHLKGSLKFGNTLVYQPEREIPWCYT